MESLIIKEEKGSFNFKYLQKLIVILNKRIDKLNNKQLIKNKIKVNFCFLNY